MSIDAAPLLIGGGLGLVFSYAINRALNRRYEQQQRQADHMPGESLPPAIGPGINPFAKKELV